MAIKIYEKITKRALSALGLNLLASANGETDSGAAILAGTGAPSGDTYGGQTLASGQAGIALRTDGTVEQLLNLTVDGGTTWDTITVASTLASTSNGEGASLVGIEDASSRYTGTDVEAALDEVPTSAELASNANGEGASLIGIEDFAGIIVGTTVEAALAENRAAIDDLEDIDVSWPVQAMGAWAVDGDGVYTNGAGLIGTEAVATAVAAAYAVVYDASNAEFNLLSAASGGTDYTADFQIFSDTGADGDYLAIGNDVPFCEVGLDATATVGVYGGAALTPKYWDGAAWQTLTLALDNTGTTATDGTTLAERDGALTFIPPADWATTTINGQDAYWVIFEVTTTANLTTAAVLADEPAIVTPSKPILAPADGQITDLHLASGAATLGSAADTKFVLVNYTTGAHSGELTWTKGTRAFSWSSLTLDVSTGDELGFLVTAEDGTNEHLNVVGQVKVATT